MNDSPAKLFGDVFKELTIVIEISRENTKCSMMNPGDKRRTMMADDYPWDYRKF